MGDFNAHNQMWGCSLTKSRGRILEEILIERDMVILNTGQATRITSNQSSNISVIDLSICSRDIALNARHIVINTNMGSDHFASITNINEEIIIEQNLSMQLWKLSKANWKDYKEASNIALTNDVLMKTNIDEKYTDLMECLIEVANQTIPRKDYKPKKCKRNSKFKPLPYWNDKCTDSIYKRNQLRNKMKKTRELGDYMAYKNQEAVVKLTLKTEAKSSWEEYCSSLTSQTKLGAVWNWARKMNGVATYSSIPTLKSNGLLAESNIDKANMLAHTYAATSSNNNYNKNFINYINNNNFEDSFDLTEDHTNNDTVAMNEKFNVNELKQAIQSAKNNKTPGDDGLPYEMVKHLHQNALKVILDFYNEVWSEGKLPMEWHHAIILPLVKPNKDTSLPESYRPISLTITLCKIMEKMVANRLQWYMEKNTLFTNNQSGFRKYRSTIDQITKLQDKILKKLKNKELMLAIFIDFERAYDMLHVPTLLRKLKKYGIVGNTANWIKSFSDKRTFQVKVGSELSDKLIQENGTPQGSVISPLLFLIMINDIPSGVDGVDMSLFADDSAIYTGHRNVKILINKIQQSIDIIHNWCDQNGFKISINKTTGVLFTNKNKIPKINIKIGNENIKMDNSAKFLGVIFDRKLSWKLHIDYILKKCKKRLNLLRALTGYHWGASKKSLLGIYKALIRSVIDYGDVAYSCASKSNLDKISVIQTEALRICCGAPRGTAASALQNECGDLPLNLRRNYNSIKLQAKIIGTKDHTCNSTSKQHWTDIFKTNQNNRTSLYYRTHEFISSLNNSFLSPSFPGSPPWISKEVDIDISLSDQINKKTDNAHFLKLAALELISKYSYLTHIYTDGSKIDDIVSAAFTIPSLDIDKKFRLCNNSTIYAAELTAIKEVLSWIIEIDKNDNCKYAIFSDSLSVLTSLKQNNCNSRPNLFYEVISLLNKLAPNQIILIWIPAHVDIKGNEKADKLAKEALNLESINSTNYLENEEVIALSKAFIINKWQTEYNNETRGHFYKSICPVVSTTIKFSDTCRKKEVQLGRLRL